MPSLSGRAGQLVSQRRVRADLALSAGASFIGGGIWLALSRSR
jgi:hypothetical protein